MTIVFTVLTLLVVIAVSTYRNMNRERERTEGSLLREGMGILRAIEAGVRVDFSSAPPEVSRVQRLIGEIGREPAIARILLFDGEGNLLAFSPGQEPGEKIKEASSLSLILREKGVITRYRQIAQEGRAFEIIKPFRPVSQDDPLDLFRGPGRRMLPEEDPLSQWAKDKIISLSLRLGAFEKARQEDIYHAFLMGGILIVLGTGALYFIFIVQNYYLVDRTLAEMKTYTENVVESMADGLISIDNQGRIVTLNRRAGEFLGAKEADLKGRGISAFLGEEMGALLRDRSIIIHGREVEVHHPSGGGIPLSLSATPLKDEMNREMGMVLLLKDLREIRDLQERVRRSERLASLGRLAAGVAHEIRNPLSSIRGFAQFFMHRLKGQEKEEEYASIMVREVDRLNRVITELLDFARPREPHREAHSLEQILGHTLKLLEPEMAKKQIAIERVYEDGLPPVRVDRDRLSQAFLNLLLNSLESMEDGGKIRIGLKRERGGGQESLKVTISDTGRGIPREDLGKVFEPFFSTKRKGTGLGLAIVHQIVESHRGEITVDSRAGEGTTFQITLPMN